MDEGSGHVPIMLTVISTAVIEVVTGKTNVFDS